MTTDVEPSSLAVAIVGAVVADSLMDRITFRQVTPADIPACYAIETASYDKDTAASKSSLQYRQHHAEQYFRCAVLEAADDDEDDEDEVVVGFICATRRRTSTSSTTDNNNPTTTTEKHETTGSLLVIHSVVVSERFRHLGIATAMMNDYWTTITSMEEEDGVERLVLVSKADLLVFFIKQCGYSVTKALESSTDNSSSSQQEQQEQQWFQLERIKETRKLQNRKPKCWIVDSFTDIAGKGNPAAVVLLDQAPSNDNDNDTTTSWFQTVAREFNLSETAFVWKINDKNTTTTTTTVDTTAALLLTERNGSDATATIDHITTNEPTTSNGNGNDNDATQIVSNNVNGTTYRIRYFSANGTEVDLCGHATLATAAVLFQEQSTLSSSLTFFANKDELIMTPAGKQTSLSLSNVGTTKSAAASTAIMPIGMNFPQKMVTELLDDDYSAVVDMLERTFPFMPKNCFESSILYIGLDQDGNDVLVEVTPECLLQLGYDGNIRYDQLDWPDYQRGVILCSTATTTNNDDSADDDNNDIDFWSRFFGPKAGIPEDPVTGSAHCTLAPYFGQKLHKTVLHAEQLSLRGGTVECTLSPPLSTERRRVTLMGSAVTAMSGTLWI
mmetsp:Transcript_32990/g.54474  ORF Transcript_32990/g.54474 Transcript_32990/m.54474 type:complete len:614 (+) Transcript_32990:264-2105(+)